VHKLGCGQVLAIVLWGSRLKHASPPTDSVLTRTADQNDPVVGKRIWPPQLLRSVPQRDGCNTARDVDARLALDR
jgi:hypothetical protein